MADQVPPTVYTGWEREGRPPAGHPQPGDLVVVVAIYRPSHNPASAYVALDLVGARPMRGLDHICQGDLAWHVTGRSGRAWWVHAIRRPTEAELTAYHLEHGGAHG